MDLDLTRGEINHLSQAAREEDEPYAILGGEVRFPDLALEGDKLLAQRGVFRNQIKFGAGEV